ncbi:MAG: 1-deoxy-D-xylulose-5-phosphate synthase [Clostridia bacterium]|nr:1-deoxy-D-xylulose-5-phosphate synthase [Clostridia bacterium]
MKKYELKEYTPDELKSLSVNQASEYCNEIRRFLIDNVSVTGGHLASNLGVCELSVALIRVFDAPKDKIIYDVGHQSYVHKILTGRCKQFDTIRKLGGLSGFTKMSESEYDAFGCGHSSTSVSAALGYAKAAKLSGEKYNSIAVIGDGAFTGGMVYEGLNNCEEDDNIIIVLNENEMSISKNVGKLSNYFLKIRNQKSYFYLKHKTERILTKLPLVGVPIVRFLETVKKLMRRLLTNSNMFEQLGIKYYGPADGNDLETVEVLLREAKKHKGPSIVHLHTVKGKGYKPAEDNPLTYHSVSGKSLLCNKYEKMSSVLGTKLSDMAEYNPKICAITAAMCEGVGLGEFEKRHPSRFFDVGIAEEHALTFAAGLAAAGYLPCVALYSTFFQRGYDQFIHDVALQNLKIILALDRAGFVGEDGPTHHGVFDVSMLLNVPDTQIFSPVSKKELEKCLLLAEQAECSTVIRYPKIVRADLCEQYFSCDATDEFYSSSQSPEVIIVSYGGLVANALDAAELLQQRGVSAGVFRVVCLKPFNSEYFFEQLEKFSPRMVYILEEGMRVGGFGEHISSVIKGYDFFIKAIEDEFVTFGNTEQLYDRYGFSPEKVADEILNKLGILDNESRFITL